MKGWKRGIAAAAAATLCLTSLPWGDVQNVSAAGVDSVAKLKPSEASPFHDTNGDGLGEFEGWGTSLCWWANRIGYSDALTQKAGELFFSDSGLDMNIGRYNVGGGDHVGEEEIQEVPVNGKAQFYDLETEGKTPEYQGTKMQVEECTDMASVTFAYSDADFGFTKGMPVGSFKKIGWINKIGDAPGEGDNLRYKVQAPEAGTYTVKLLLTLTGSNKRDVVLGVGGEEYLVSADVINSNMIASGNNNMLFVVTIPNVALQAGENEVVIAGKADWTLDFVKMAVMKSGDEGVLAETEDEFLHEPHIIRSDSGVPGYATDVTKIDTSQHELSWYEENFARADAECGYAWNYNWDADKNQINVLKAAAAASGQDFIAEAFSNSPPYFMTVSGCSSGNTDSNKDNLRADSVNAFAAYMADVIEHWQNNGITFQSATPMNEPYTNYWGANSNKQEGCHFDQGESQSRIIVALNNALKEKGIDLILSATDETSIDTQITSYNALSEEAKSVVSRIDTHSYSGSDREGLKTTAQEAGKNLWMSEVDGAYTGGTNAGEMSAALGLAQTIMKDVNGLDATAWILWNAIDMHADSSEYGQSWVNKGSANDYLSMEALEAAWKSRSANGYWGLAAADHDNQDIVLSMKYYGYGQFSRYIRPGYTIIGSSKGTTLAAYDPNGKKAVIVAMNTSDQDKNWKFDLSGFETMGEQITAIRTSGTMAEGEKWADVTDSDNIAANTENRFFTADMKANSITTYIVEGVSGIREVTEEEKPEVKQIAVTEDQVTGEKVWNNGTVNTPAKVVDNNYETFFDGVDTDNGEAGYIVIDLGEVKEIAALGYAPRSGFADRCVGGTFYGSADGITWTMLYTIEEAPKQNTDTMVYASDFLTGKAETFQYIKYAREEQCNVSELKVYEKAPVLSEEEILNQAKEELDIPNKEDVRGNITLPDKTESGVEITWATDHPEMVDVNVQPEKVEGYGEVPAGVVTRPAADTQVTMTATLTYKGQTITKDIVLQVKAAPEAIEESDYTDYFFAYFAGEGYEDGEQIYFASSQDGMNWEDLNSNQPVLTSTLGEKGVRDPFIIRSPEGDKFYLIATDLKINGKNDWTAAQEAGSQSLMVWESTDLVNWSEQRMVEISADIDAGCTWAPEATYDPATGEYVVYWASKVAADKYAKQRVYYAKTRDFYTFTEPQIYIEKDESSIDTTIIENNGTYYRYTKNEGGNTNEVGASTKTIFLEKSSNVLGTYTSVPSEILNQNQYVEGPTIFKLNQDDAAQDTWCLLVDDFGGIGYYPLVTNDLESGDFTVPEKGTYRMPSRARHGTPLRITSAEYEVLTAAYGTPKTVESAVHAGEIPDLPETVTVGKTEKAVTWNLDGVSFEGIPYSYVTVEGTVEGSNASAKAQVQIIPENVEYMIDCNNPGSSSWKNASALEGKLLNEAADQAKTEENTWGYVSTVGGDGNDMTAFDMENVSNPYAGGWYARGGKNISYQVTLPEGEHQIMMGCTGWWNMDRPMDVYYSLDGQTETKLFDLDAVKGTETFAQGTIYLEKETLVTLTVKKAVNDDPILSWISISGEKEAAPEIDVSKLQEKVQEAEKLSEADYTTGSYSKVTESLKKGKELLENPTTQEEVNSAITAIQSALDGLVNIAELRDYYQANKDKTEKGYTKDTYQVYQDALTKAKEALENPDLSQADADTALKDLKAAVEGLKEETKNPVSKDKLKNLYESYVKLEAEGYTEESYAKFTEALKAAKKVLEDENATQKEVDEAYSNLYMAKEALERKQEEESESKPENQKPSSGSEQTGTKPDSSGNPAGTNQNFSVSSTGAKTGDETPVAAALLLTVCALGAVVFVWKKKERMYR